MSNTNFVSFRELRTSTSKINEMLNDDGKIIITNNGKPKALMINISDVNFEETLSIINQVKLTRAINNIRAAAQHSGAAEMTINEINDEIAQSRKERRERQKSGDAG